MSKLVKSPKQPELFAQVCKTFRLPEPVPEFIFHPDRKWRIDYYFEANDRKVALEVEGGLHSGGRHVSHNGIRADMEKYNALSVAGIFLVRCTPETLMNASTFATLKSVLYGKQD